MGRAFAGAVASVVLFGLSWFVVPPSHADQGVGVTLGSIVVEERLVPGGSWELARLGVLNTGDEPGPYEVTVSYADEANAKRPPAGWFEFSPARFDLAAGDSRMVEVRLTLPTGADAGEYFAYLEAHPVTSGEGVSVSVAAATKVSFTVKDASWLSAQRTRVNRWLDDNQLLIWGFVAVAVAALLYKYRSRFPWQIDVRRK
jgi:hypothetical protein